MMRKSGKIIYGFVVIAVLISVFASGCGYAVQQEEANNNSLSESNVVEGTTNSSESENGEELDSIDINESEKNIEKLADHLYLNLSEDVSDEKPESDSYGVVSVELQEINYQKLANAIFGREVELEDISDESYRSYTLTDDEDTFSYRCDDDKWLDVSFSSSFSTQIRYVFRNYSKIEIMNELGDTTTFFNQDEDLSFLSSEEAENTVRQFLTECGLSLLDQVEIYALTKENLKKAEDYLDSKGELEDLRTGESLKKGTWSEEDECYYMVFKGDMEGLPVYQLSVWGEETTFAEGTEIEVIYSKEGIQYLEIHNPYRVTENSQEKQTILSKEEALEQLKNMYDEIIDNDEKIVEQCYLCYLPVFQKDGIFAYPVWCMEVHTKIDDMDIWEDFFLNAITGEWITGV